MPMKHLFWLLCGCFLTFTAFAQENASTDERIADFNITPQGKQFQFTPLLPPLRQIAGAPPAFYDYYWEFGDGSFSFEDTPSYSYPLPGEYDVQLMATGKYDNGSAPRKRRRRVVRDTSTVIAAGAEFNFPNVLDSEWDALGIKAIRNARPGEELACIFSYKNTLPLTQSGQLYFFYNEKIYAKNHFQFGEARTHFGEENLEDTQGLSLHLPPRFQAADFWAGSSEGDLLSAISHSGSRWSRFTRTSQGPLSRKPRLAIPGA